MSAIDISAADSSSSVAKKDQITNEIAKSLLPKDVKPPATFEEYLALTTLTDWPVEVRDEDLVKDFKTETQEQLFKLLKSATLIPEMNPLQDLSYRMQNFEERLCQHAEKLLIVCDPIENALQDPCSQESSVLDETLEKIGENEGEMLYNALKANSVDFCKFPGFNSTQLTNLPDNREPTSILETVTVAQSFKSGFLKVWNKIFQSEASVAILLDAFWWTFLDRFQPTERKERGQLFDRIADSFVALISSIHLELKDKFIVVYADCLAQAIFVAYFRLFPESGHYFDESFKDYLIDTVHEWVTGVHPPVGRWKQWKTDILLKETESSVSSGVNISTLSAVVHANCDLGVGFRRFKEELDEVIVDLFDEEKKRIKTTSDAPNFRFSLIAGKEESLARCKETRPVLEEAKKERTLFNMKAHSPLVSHYLKMLGIRAAEAADARREFVSRTREARL